MDRRRILIIIAFILSVIVFGWLLYYFFFRQLISPAGPGANQNNNANLPTPVNGNTSVLQNRNTNANLPPFGTIDVTAPTDIARGGLTKVVDYGTVQASNFVSGPDGAYFYDKNASLFEKLQGTTIMPLSTKQFFNVDKVVWSPNQDKAIMEYPDGSNIIYDFTTNKQITLPKELTDFAFDPTSSSIAGKWYGDTNDENWLMVGSVDGSNFRLIEPIGDQGTNVQVGYSPDSQMVALVRKPADANTQTVLPIGLNGENFPQFTVKGLKFESKWAPTGDTLLYNVSASDSDWEPQLYLTTGSTETLGSSQLNLQLRTWASKCAFDSNATSIYCAEPLSLPRGSGLYPEVALGTPDAFYRIDLKSGQKIPLALPVGNQSSYSAQSVFLSSDESLLYFVDAQTNRLHSIRLK